MEQEVVLRLFSTIVSLLTLTWLIFYLFAQKRFLLICVAVM